MGLWLSESEADDTYKTIDIDAGAFIPVETAGAETDTHEYATYDINRDAFIFSNSILQKAQFALFMDERWDLSTIKAKMDWTSETGSTIGDTAEWGIKAVAIRDGDAIDSDFGTPQVISDAILGTNGIDRQLTAATPAITVGGTPDLGCVVFFEVYRNVSGTDDMGFAAWLNKVIIQYKTSADVVTAW